VIGHQSHVLGREAEQRETHAWIAQLVRGQQVMQHVLSVGPRPDAGQGRLRPALNITISAAKVSQFRQWPTSLCLTFGHGRTNGGLDWNFI